MAPLTWRNVDAPSFAGVNQALALAAQNFNTGLGAGIDALGSFQEGRTVNDSNKLALDIMKYQDPESYKAALMNGTVQAGVDPRNLNADAINFMAGYEGKLIGNNQAGANLTGTNLANAAQSFNNDQGVFAASIQNPIKIAQAEDFWKGRLTNKTSDQIIADLVDNSQSPQDAILGAQVAAQNGDISPEVLRSVIGDLQNNGSTYFANAPQSLADQLLRPNQPGAQPSYIPGNTPSFVEYSNQNAKRNDPLSANLINTMSFLPEMGVTMEVVSGGQEDNKANGTGSTRHNHGEAGDVKFKYNGRTLSWENEADVPMLQQIVSRGRENGLTGIGGGPGYMNPETTHIGFGNEAVWGAEGGSPYPALLDAFNSTKPGTPAAENRPAYQAMLDTVSNGGNYEAPININKPGILNDDGTISTEQVITTQIDGNWINIPTVVGGQPFTEEEAINLFRSGQNPAVGAFETLDQAEKAAEARTDEIGRMLDEAANGTSSPVAAASVASPNAPTPVQQAQTITATSNVNQAFNTNAPINAQIASANNNEPIGSVTKRVSEETGLPANAVTEAIQQIRDQYGLSPAAAGIIVADSVEVKDLTRTNMFGETPVLDLIFGPQAQPDRFGGATEGTTAPRIDMEKVAATVAGYRDGTDISEGVNQLIQQENSSQVAPTAQKIVSAIASLDAEFAIKQASGNITQVDIARYQADKAALLALLEQTGVSPAGTNYVQATEAIK